MSMILLSNKFVGGDTGTTHYAAKMYPYGIDIIGMFWKMSKFDYFRTRRSVRYHLSSILKKEYNPFVKDKFCGDLTPIPNKYQDVSLVNRCQRVFKVSRQFRKILKDEVKSCSNKDINIIQDEVASILNLIRYGE